jgi:signal transduction histidine kinase
VSETRAPRRFRRRLTSAFVLTAAITTGVLAIVSYTISSERRQRNFEQRNRNEVRVALALAPQTLDEHSFETILRVYETRTGSDAIAIDGDPSYSSSNLVTAADVPAELYDDIEDRLRTTRLTTGGREYLVIVGLGPNSEHYAFFFSLDQLRDGLAELRRVLLGGWVTIVVLSLAVGHLVARRTLRPVREAAVAATAMADGKLDTRIQARGDDEFSHLARSFNTMADALQMKIDELNRAADRERQFTANVAHDLRTPLTGMTAMASLLREHLEALPPDARGALQIIIQDSERLKNLVLELLELANLDSGTDVVLPEELDVADAVAATVDSLSVAPGVTVAVDVPAGLTIHAERPRFRRALGNLVLNAMTHGGGSVSIVAERAGDDVLIHVCDEGPGIDPALRDSAFDRFVRGDPARTQGGSGLGLAIAREQARAQGGDVVAGDNHGRGARFTLRLPRTSTPSRVPNSHGAHG